MTSITIGKLYKYRSGFLYFFYETNLIRQICTVARIIVARTPLFPRCTRSPASTIRAASKLRSVDTHRSPRNQIWKYTRRDTWNTVRIHNQFRL